MASKKPRTGKMIECKTCSKEFYVPKNRLKTAKYCSMSCHGHGTTTKQISKCQTCGKDFEHKSSRANTAKYCSRPCYYKAQSKKGSITKRCHHCESEFKVSPSSKKKYCSKACVGKESKKTFKPSFTTVRKAMIARGLLNKCERCGFDKYPNILGVHHKDRNRNNNEMSNLEVLCPNCHSIEHNKHICH